MIRRPPRSTLDRSSAASDVYKRQVFALRREHGFLLVADEVSTGFGRIGEAVFASSTWAGGPDVLITAKGLTNGTCLLYKYDAADERSSGDLGGRRCLKKKKKDK